MMFRSGWTWPRATPTWVNGYAPRETLSRHLPRSSRRERSVKLLVNEFPDKPRYREQLAGLLGNMALALEAVDPKQVEATYLASLSIYEKLVADHPENVNYRIGQSICVRNFGPFLVSEGRSEQAESIYHKALALLEPKEAGARSPELLRIRAGVLNNLGELLVASHRWQEGQEMLRGAMAVFESLAARESPTDEDLHNLAIAQNNLGDLLIKLERFAEAGPLLRKVGRAVPRSC